MIYHITSAELWEKALQDGKDKGSYSHPSLQIEGFIHCSTKDQLHETLRLHFADKSEVVLLLLNERKLKDVLRWEASRNGELFPHLYGKIPLQAVLDIKVLDKQPDGSWE